MENIRGYITYYGGHRWIYRCLCRHASMASTLHKKFKYGVPAILLLQIALASYLYRTFI